MTASAIQTRDSGVERIALEAARIGTLEGGPASPARVLIVPWGDVRSASGHFVVDADGAAQAIGQFTAHGADLPVDYEHQTLGGKYASPNGQAPAAGWITRLHLVTPDSEAEVSANADGTVGDATTSVTPGLWADVTWTEDALQHLAARRYRYLSPVALIRRSDRRLIGVHSAALTNKPAIVGMTPVVNREAATDASIVDLTPLRTVLRLDDSICDEAIIAGAVSRVRELERRECERVADRRVEAASRAGKLAAPQRDWAHALAMKDGDEFDRWLASAPVLVSLGRTTPPVAGMAPSGGTHRSIESAARAEWQANRAFLERICTEDAYVASATRGIS